MYDYNKLKGRIKEILGTQTKFAELMELSNTSIISKLAGRVDFTQSEIKKAVEILSISTLDIPKYFFEEKVQKNWTLKKVRCFKIQESDLKELVRVLSTMTAEEWESFKSYVNHKFKMNGKIENTELSIKTLETFFLKVKKAN